MPDYLGAEWGGFSASSLVDVKRYLLFFGNSTREGRGFPVRTKWDALPPLREEGHFREPNGRVG